MRGEEKGGRTGGEEEYHKEVFVGRLAIEEGDGDREGGREG